MPLIKENVTEEERVAQLEDLASRRVQIVGSTPSPNHLFMRQVGRTLTAADDGVLVSHRVLICEGREVERARSRAAGRGRNPRRADALSGP